MEPFPKRPLVSVEWQTERNLETGAAQRRMFVKMYFDARDSGLLANIPDDLWKTLCLLATYVNEDGFCFPSQDTVARALGIGRQAANRRIRRLREYRFEGRPVLSVNRERVRSAKGPTRWGRNVYQLHPIAAFAFGDSQQRDATRDSSMSPQRDIESSMSLSMSAPADIASSRDMNKSQVLNKNTHGVCEGGEGEGLVEAFHRERGSARSRPTARELSQAGGLLARVGMEKASYVVRFAVTEARKTRFQMRHFGAVLGYEADALAAYSKHARTAGEQRRRKTEDALAELRGEYERWCETELDARYRALPTSERQALDENARAQVEAERGSQHVLGFETLVRLSTRNQLAQIHSLPRFEEWQEGRVYSRKRLATS